MIARIIVAGSRTFDDYQTMSQKLDTLLSRLVEDGVDIEIVSGTARGADSLGERYARERGYQLKQFPAQWDKHGKAAGPIRNRQMANYAQYCVAFWDGKSRGTEHMIATAKQMGLMLRVHIHDKRQDERDI